MVTKMYYFKNKHEYNKWCRERGYKKKACEEAWSGPGWYYARKKDHISKHVPHLDKRRGGKIGRGAWRHMHDLDRLLSKLEREVEKILAKKARKLEKLPSKERAKVKEAVKARLAAKAAKKASKTWTRNKAIRSLAADLWRMIPKRYKQGKQKAWTYVAVLALAKAIHDAAREKGVDPYQYDWRDLIDWSLGYDYALSVVQKTIGTKDLKRSIEAEIRRWQELQEMYSSRQDAVAAYENLTEQEIEKELQYLDEMFY